MVKAWTNCYLARCLSHLQPAAKLYFREVAAEWHDHGAVIQYPRWRTIEAAVRLADVASPHRVALVFIPRDQQELNWVGQQFLQYAVPGPQRVLFRENARSQAGKIIFLYRYCLWLAVRNVRDIIAVEIFQWTSLSEFGQDNGLTRNTGARWKLKGPTDFYRSQYLKINFNPWVNYCSFFIPWRLGGWVGK